LFTLRQSLELYRIYQQQMGKCDQEIEKLAGPLRTTSGPGKPALTSGPEALSEREKESQKSGRGETEFNLRTEAYKLFGVDVTQIPGVETLALPLFGEVGRDMSKWPTADHFASWQGLCPDNDVSGGRIRWQGTRRVHNRAGQMFRHAAYSLHHNLTPLGDYLRRMRSKLGPSAAITATAHKIAVIFYTLVKNQVEYDETLWATRDIHRKKRIEAKLKRQAWELGYRLIPMETEPATQGSSPMQPEV